VPQVLVAAPSYLEKFGEPRHPEELAQHSCLVHLLSAGDNTWQFRSETGECAIVIDGGIKSELGEALRSAALLGRGISVHPVFMLVDDLRAGRLKAIMPGWTLPEMHVRAVYSSNIHVPGRVKTFLDFLRKWFHSNREYKL
jgi:DNA-binding transcriptional LysR family regulator